MNMRACAVVVAVLFLFVCPGLATTITQTGTGGAIPDLNTLVLTMVITDTDLISSSGQNVTLHLAGLTHPRIGDLTVTLEHLGYGSAVAVMDRVGTTGGGSLNTNLGGDYSFDNDYTGDLWTAASHGSGTNKPIASGEYFPTSAGVGTETPFSDLWNDQTVEGTWILRITDGKKNSTGSLASWGLDFSVGDNSEPPDPGEVPEPATTAMLAGGLLGLALLKRRIVRRKS